MSFLALVALCSLAVCSASVASRPAAGGGYTLVESATLVHPGDQSDTAAETTSTGDPFTWGAVDLPIPAKLKLGQLTNLSTDFKIVTGSCWGGSPRFEAWVTTPTGPRKLHFYIGAAPNYTGCPSGVYGNTGNVASPMSAVDDSQLGGSGSDPYSTVQARFGKYAVTHVYVDLDGGWYADQVVDFDNTRVNNKLTIYEQ